ncbi:hypothetical protein [Lacrimispora aerotolerans]|uniref:hypothetical protein n=1 Tax=Lacrimispora aerotolerans TaxID=36832 RepID=UPI00047CA521|nr:hypothetical protein [Lacrimispora aerotolerans]
MSSTNKTSLGLNMWEASDKPVRQDFVNDNIIIDEEVSKLNSRLNEKANAEDLANKQDKDVLILPNGTNVFEYADNFKLGYNGMIRIMNGPIYPEGYTSNNDFWFSIIRLNDPNVKYWRIIAYDIRANRTFSAACINGSIVSWKEL